MDKNITLKEFSTAIQKWVNLFAHDILLDDHYKKVINQLVNGDFSERSVFGDAIENYRKEIENLKIKGE